MTSRINLIFSVGSVFRNIPVNILALNTSFVSFAATYVNSGIMKKKPNKEILDAMSRNSDYWKGPFYFNRKDPRLVVPKLNPAMGMTLNFANPYVYLLLISIILILVVVQFL